MRFNDEQSIFVKWYERISAGKFSNTINSKLNLVTGTRYMNVDGMRLDHLAQEHISIDLDDGVKVNYEKVQTDRDGRKYQILAPIK